MFSCTSAVAVGDCWTSDNVRRSSSNVEGNWWTSDVGDCNSEIVAKSEDFWTSDDVSEPIDEVRDGDWFSWRLNCCTSDVDVFNSEANGVVAARGYLWRSNAVFELVDEVRDDGWCSCGGVEGNWWISEVDDWCSGTTDVVGTGDLSKSNDVFELIDEVRVDGWFSWLVVVEDFWVSDNVGRSSSGVEVNWRTSEVDDCNSGTVGVVDKSGDFGMSDDDFELLDEVRDNGSSSCGGDCWRLGVDNFNSEANRVVAARWDLWRSNAVFELVDDVRDDGWCSCGGVEDNWWISEVDDLCSGITVVVGTGDLSKSNDVFELIDEVRVDGWFSWLVVVEDFWVSDNVGRSSSGVEVNWWTSAMNDCNSGTVGVVDKSGDFGMSGDDFELVDEVRDDGWCSCGEVEGDWFAWKDVSCSVAAVGMVDEVGDLWTSDDVPAFIDEVRDDGCCISDNTWYCCGDIEDDWRISNANGMALIGEVFWSGDEVVGDDRTSGGVGNRRLWVDADRSVRSIEGIDEVGDFCVPVLTDDVRDVLSSCCHKLSPLGGFWSFDGLFVVITVSIWTLFWFVKIFKKKFNFHYLVFISYLVLLLIIPFTLICTNRPPCSSICINQYFFQIKKRNYTNQFNLI